MRDPAAAPARAHTIAGNIVRMLTNNVGILVLNVIATVVLSRWLLPEGKGMYTLAMLVPLTLARVAGLGVPQALTHFAGKDETRVSALLGGGTALALGAGSACVIGFWLFDRAYPVSILAHVPAGTKLTAACAVPLVLWTQAAASILLGLDRQAAYRAVRVAEALGLVCGVTGLVAVGGLRVSGALGAWIGAQACAGVVAVWGLWQAGVLRFTWDASLLRRCMRYGGLAWISGVASYLLLRADLYLVNAFLGPAAVGHYSIAVAVFMLMFTVPMSAAAAVLPHLTRADAADARRIGTLTARCITAACTALAVGGALAAPVLIPAVFGSAYAAAVRPLMILMPAFLVLGGGAIAHAGLQGLGQIRYPAYANVGGLVLNLTLNLMWIPRWGLAGAAAATSVSYTFVSAVLVLAYAAHTGSSVRDLVLMRRADWTGLVRAARERVTRLVQMHAPAPTPHSPA